MKNTGANIFYIRGVLNGFVGNLDLAINDIEQAIEKSEENVAQYFFFRGHVHACANNIRHAIDDYQVAINLDPQYG